MSELKEFDAIFAVALERHLTRTLAAREKAIEQARQALRAAAEEDERVLAETEAELQALDPAREEVAVSLHRGAATSASPEERLSPRQRVLYGQLMDRLVSGGPLELSAEEELLACLPDE